MKNKNEIRNISFTSTKIIYYITLNNGASNLK